MGSPVPEGGSLPRPAPHWRGRRRTNSRVDSGGSSQHIEGDIRSAGQDRHAAGADLTVAASPLAADPVAAHEKQAWSHSRSSSPWRPCWPQIGVTSTPARAQLPGGEPAPLEQGPESSSAKDLGRSTLTAPSRMGPRAVPPAGRRPSAALQWVRMPSPPSPGVRPCSAIRRHISSSVDGPALPLQHLDDLLPAALPSRSHLRQHPLQRPAQVHRRGPGGRHARPAPQHRVPGTPPPPAPGPPAFGPAHTGHTPQRRRWLGAPHPQTPPALHISSSSSQTSRLEAGSESATSPSGRPPSLRYWFSRFSGSPPSDRLLCFDYA